MSSTRDDERDYDRRQERIAEAKDRRQEVRDAIVKYEDLLDRRGHAGLRSEIAKLEAENTRLRSELDHLRGWREGAESAAEEARKEIARLEADVSRHVRAEARAPELEAENASLLKKARLAHAELLRRRDCARSSDYDYRDREQAKALSLAAEIVGAAFGLEEA